MTSKPSEEFEKFDKAMDKIMSVSKEELKRRLKAEEDRKAEAKRQKKSASKSSQSVAGK
jgi:hypothetical protein